MFRFRKEKYFFILRSIKNGATAFVWQCERNAKRIQKRILCANASGIKGLYKINDKEINKIASFQ